MNICQHVSENNWTFYLFVGVLYCVACLYYSSHVVHARLFCCVLPEEAQMAIQRSPAIG